MTTMAEEEKVHASIHSQSSSDSFYPPMATGGKKERSLRIGREGIIFSELSQISSVTYGSSFVAVGNSNHLQADPGRLTAMYTSCLGSTPSHFLIYLKN